MSSRGLSGPEEYGINAQATQMLDELKEELRRSVALAEDYRRQIQELQSRLHDASQQQGKLEMQLHEQGERIEALEAERKDLLPTSSVPARQNSAEAQSKSKLIETLRCQLVESQSKVLEVAESKEVRVQELEETLQGARATVARLVEDSESYQLLLNEKILNGDYTRGSHLRFTDSGAGDENESRPDEVASPSLADELQSVRSDEDEHRDRLEGEMKNVKDQNKALSLYINHLLERLLQHKDCESILDKTPSLPRGVSSTNVPGRQPRNVNTDKELPVTPPKDEQPVRQRPRPTGPAALRSSSGGVLRPRPLSFMAAAPFAVPVAEGSSSGPGAQLRRSSSIRGPGSRAISFERSEATKNDHTSAPTSNLTRSASTMMPASRRYSLFSTTSNLGALGGAANGGSTGTRTPSGGQSVTGKAENDQPGSPTGAYHDHDRSMALSGMSGGQQHSTPAVSSASTAAGNSMTTTPALAGNKLRPLRLVQGQTSQGGAPSGSSITNESDLDKKAKRSSWMGWFNKGKLDDPASGAGGLPMGGHTVKE